MSSSNLEMNWIKFGKKLRTVGGLLILVIIPFIAFVALVIQLILIIVLIIIAVVSAIIIVYPFVPAIKYFFNPPANEPFVEGPVQSSIEKLPGDSIEEFGVTFKVQYFTIGNSTQSSGSGGEVLIS